MWQCENTDSLRGRIIIHFFLKKYNFWSLHLCFSEVIAIWALVLRNAGPKRAVMSPYILRGKR